MFLTIMPEGVNVINVREGAMNLHVAMVTRRNFNLSMIIHMYFKKK